MVGQFRWETAQKYNLQCEKVAESWNQIVKNNEICLIYLTKNVCMKAIRQWTFFVDIYKWQYVYVWMFDGVHTYVYIHIYIIYIRYCTLNAVLT